MVTTVYLIRHGATEGSSLKRYKGSLNVPLSEEGERQVEATSLLLRDIPLKAVYTSTLQRAIKSAEVIASHHNLAPTPIHGLRERGFGVWEGISYDEIREKYPSEFEAWADNPLRFSPMGGESTLEVKGRVIQALAEILSGHNGDAIAIVAHGGVNRIMLCEFLGIPLENIFRIEQDFACLNIIELWESGPVVKLLNGRPL